jgi:hypothetical protein
MGIPEDNSALIALTYFSSSMFFSSSGYYNLTEGIKILTICQSLLTPPHIKDFHIHYTKGILKCQYTTILRFFVLIEDCRVLKIRFAGQRPAKILHYISFSAKFNNPFRWALPCKKAPPSSHHCN